jgi:DNA-binding transcriptional regulator GbsR (MarR family)
MDEHAQQQYVEDMGLYFERLGTTRMAGRMIGWLLICDPPHQSMAELEDALQAAKSTISTTIRLLEQLYLIERVSLPGERRTYFRLAEDLWMRSWRGRMAEIVALRQMAERGLAIMADAPESTRTRLKRMHAMNAFLEREFPKMLDRWQEEADNLDFES